MTDRGMAPSSESELDEDGPELCLLLPGNIGLVDLDGRLSLSSSESDALLDALRVPDLS